LKSAHSSVKSKSRGVLPRLFCVLGPLVLAAQAVRNVVEDIGDYYRKDGEQDVHTQRCSPAIHPVLQLQFFLFDILPAPDEGIKPADEAEDGVHDAFLLVKLDHHHDQADEHGKAGKCH
jgi:hypothetical protein